MRAPDAGGRRVRVRSWPGASRDRAAIERAELATLEQGIRFRTIFLILMGTILAIAAINVLTGTVGLVRETRSRPMTAAEQARYVQEDIARRWHTWPADLVFPVELQYIGLGRVQQYARRVGLAPEVACAAGVDAPVGSVLTEYGCRTLLRATYVDQTSTFAFWWASRCSPTRRNGSPRQVSWRSTTGWGCGRWRSPARRPSCSAPPSGSATPGSGSAPTSSSPPADTPTAVPASRSLRRRSCTASSGRRPRRSPVASPTPSETSPARSPSARRGTCAEAEAAALGRGSAGRGLPDGSGDGRRAGGRRGRA
ncbi:hypothetical protein ACFQX6_50895 [Streptosporangium lutulentum]